MDSESEDSEDMDSNSDSDFEVHPSDAAWAALLVARFAVAIQATKELQALHNRPQLLALEKLALKCLDTGDAAFLNQKRIFRMMPGRLLEKINRELSYMWRHPRLAGMVMNSHSRHLSLDLVREFYRDVDREKIVEVEGWSLEELRQLCDHIAREGKTSLRSLEIENSSKPEGTHPGLSVAMLSSLLQELRALTSLHLGCYLQTEETDVLVSNLASTNPDIRSLRLPRLSYKSLCTIAARWPQLEALEPDQHEFDSSQLEAVMPRLRNLQKLKTISRGKFSAVMLSVARAHDPASPPYKLADGFSYLFNESLSSGDMINLFTAFPALYWLDLRETDIPAVCAGLEGREHVHITELLVWPTSPDPRALEPLLALVGRHVTKLRVLSGFGFLEGRVDLNMIGHYCRKLEDLRADVRALVSGDEFEVIESHFSKLEICNLRHNMAGNNPAQLPDPLVCRALGSPTLEDFESRGVPITEEVVAALAAERGRGALSSLKELKIWHPTPVNVETLAALVSHAPRLQTLTLNTCHLGDEDEEGEELQEMRGVLTSFVQQSELDASVCVSYF